MADSSTELTAEMAVERMARAGCTDSLPTDGMFNEHQLDVMYAERIVTYRRIARVMFLALLGSGDSDAQR